MDSPNGLALSCAALPALYARGTNGALPAGAANWYSAVMRYSQLSDTRAAASFADAVYATINQGAWRITDDGQAIVLGGLERCVEQANIGNCAGYCGLALARVS